MKKTAMPQNYKKEIDWIIDAYELAQVTFADGFQKDAIQNASGARAKDKWDGWKCKIDLINNKKGSFLIIEDEGTEGLTGPNISAEEIMRMIDSDEDIDEEWRLARFSSRNVSGGNRTGAGKYGVGKSVYSACSKSYDYCFDSLRKDGRYVANRNEAGQIFEQALEGEEAKKYISDLTGLRAKETVGTRIIIFDPKEEICDSIISGEISSYIQESWWRCIEKMPKDSGIYINGKRVELPALGPYENKYQTTKAELYAPGYRVKKFGFFINSKTAPVKWRGISYYRKGMKIGTVEIQDIPNSIKDRFWGFLEVDKEWEELLSEIEDAVHYGVKSGKKHTTTYQNMRLYISKKVNQLLIDWGYIKDKEHENKKLQDALKEISSELQELFDDMGFEDLGKGPKKPDFSVSWKDIVFPHKGSSSVSTGDVIKFGFRVHNNYLTDREFEYTVEVISKSDNHRVCSLKKGVVGISSDNYYDEQFKLEISASTAERYEENVIVLNVKAVGSNKEKRKELPFFFDTEKEDSSRREVTLSLHSLTKPHENSMRVNFGEKVSNLIYLVDNKRNRPLEFSLNLSLHNCEDQANPKIMDICKITGTATPYESVLIDGLPDVVFDEKTIKPYLEAGVIELRARLIATADSDEFEKGDKITHFYLKLYLNKDEKSGKEGAFEPRTVDDSNDFRRSWCKGGSRLIFINSAHPAYKASQGTDEDWKSYMKQEMLKQYVLLYLEEGKYAMFSKEKDITTMDPIEASKCVMDKIEEVYERSFK